MFVPHYDGSKKIVILTGAGISAPSGIQTFRGTDGLWNNCKIDEICNENTWFNNYIKVNDFYDERRFELKDKEPNVAHFKIKELMDKYKDDVILITQNVDDLFERANVDKDKIMHVHGFLKEVICQDCNTKIDIGYEKVAVDNYSKFDCPSCNKKTNVKPNIVLFNGQAPMYSYMHRAFEYLQNPNSLFIVIGTSGNVIDVNRVAKKARCKTILANMEQSEAIEEYFFHKIYYGNIEETIFKIEEFIQKNFKEI